MSEMGPNQPGGDVKSPGAGTDEVWKTSGHATLPDNILMVGI